MVTNMEKVASNFLSYKKVIVKLLIVFFIINNNNVFAQNLDSIVLDKTNYSFIVGGHAYGSHQGTNTGLYPKFLKKLKENKNEYDFVILAGDFIRDNNNNNWYNVIKELDNINKPYFLVMGNNDISPLAQNIFTENFGNTYYSFKVNTELFIILDTQIEQTKITKAQLDFIKNILYDNPNIKNVFIFFSELLWNQNIKYKNIKANKASRYKRIQKSNFWTSVIPIIENYKLLNYYFVAGDVAGNIDAIPAFYYKEENKILIATGMGEVKEENYLTINIKNSIANIEIKPLNGIRLKKIEYYNTENMKKYFKPNKSVIFSKIKMNINHIQFKRGFLTASIIFILLISFYFFFKYIKKIKY